MSETNNKLSEAISTASSHGPTKEFLMSEEELQQHNNSDQSNLSSMNIDERVKALSLTALMGLIELTQSNEGWNYKTVNEIHCYSKQIKGRKVVKLESEVETSAEHLWSILYPGTSTPEWNKQCGANDIIYSVDTRNDIVYTISKAVGPISARDFVSARKVVFTRGSYYIACMSIVTELKPEERGKVRGENGPCGYVVIPVNDKRCQFIWVYNSAIKGWLPQVVVDQAAVAALIGAHQSLLSYVKDQTQLMMDHS